MVALRGWLGVAPVYLLALQRAAGQTGGGAASMTGGRPPADVSTVSALGRRERARLTSGRVAGGHGELQHHGSLQ